MFYKVPKEMLDAMPDDIKNKIEDECEYIGPDDESGEPKEMGMKEEKPEGESMGGDKGGGLFGAKPPMNGGMFGGPDEGLKKEVPDMGEKAKRGVKSFDDASDKGMSLMIAIGKKEDAKKAAEKKKQNYEG